MLDTICNDWTLQSDVLQHANDGVRLYGVKFLEALILLYIPEATSKGTTENGACAAICVSPIARNTPSAICFGEQPMA